MKKLVLGISVLLLTMSCDSNDYPINQNESTNSKVISKEKIDNQPEINARGPKRPGMTS